MTRCDRYGCPRDFKEEFFPESLTVKRFCKVCGRWVVTLTFLTQRDYDAAVEFRAKGP